MTTERVPCWVLPLSQLRQVLIDDASITPSLHHMGSHLPWSLPIATRLGLQSIWPRLYPLSCFAPDNRCHTHAARRCFLSSTKEVGVELRFTGVSSLTDLHRQLSIVHVLRIRTRTTAALTLRTVTAFLAVSSERITHATISRPGYDAINTPNEIRWHGRQRSKSQDHQGST